MPTPLTSDHDVILETRLRQLRATPEELAQLRATAPIIRPIAELLGGPPVPATPDEIEDLEDWLAEREAQRARELGLSRNVE